MEKFLIFTILWQLSSSLTMSPLRWCTISPAELQKCNNLARAMEQDAILLSNTYTRLECIQRSNHEECMVLLYQEDADIVQLDPHEIFIAGRYHSLIPIMKEVYDKSRQYYYSVALIKKGNMSDVSSLEDLEGKVGCFPSVASMGGWILPIAKLIKTGAMKIVDCNNHIKSASEFFSGGCAVNILSDKYNPLGDNNQVLCSACGSDLPGQHCTSQDIYAGYQGALKCLLDKGDIAFVKHSTLDRAVAAHPEDFKGAVEELELLCEDGTHRPLTEYEQCNWGSIPSNAIVTTSAKSLEQRRNIQDFLKELVNMYGKKAEDNPGAFKLFESSMYGKSHDLLLSDDTEALVDLAVSQQNFQRYLVGNIMNHIQTVRSCPVPQMRLCVTSFAEFSKCLKMRTALHAQLLKPEMECIKGESNFDCMSSIQKREADVAVFEAGDIYSAGLMHELVPIMAEQYNLETLEYYVVAVSKEDDPDTDVLYLKGKISFEE
ncbi:Ferric iron binding [Halocaridina rubra]|uniref:Ferric iron binding n=1 Tax=Halocaridina rubra TaxID=373956 RepID=A0AAN8WEU8_HALRR